MKGGEDKAWTDLAACAPVDVCRRAPATWAQNVFTVDMFREPVRVDPAARRVTATGPVGEILLGKLRYFSVLSLLNYLVSARDVPCTGRPVKAADLRTGRIYYEGSHRLPLAKITGMFGADPDGFRARGEALGGDARDYGDASVCLWPFPRFPVTLVLWRRDEEFPARAELLFDAGCETHLAADLIWSTAMMTVLLV